MADFITHRLYKKTYTIWHSTDQGSTWTAEETRKVFAEYDGRYGVFSSNVGLLATQIDVDKNVHICTTYIVSDTTSDTTYGNQSLVMNYSMGENENTFLIKANPPNTYPYYGVGMGQLIVEKISSDTYKGYVFYPCGKYAVLGGNYLEVILLVKVDIINGTVSLDTVEEVTVRNRASSSEFGAVNVYLDANSVFHIAHTRVNYVTATSSYSLALDSLTYDGNSFTLESSDVFTARYTDPEIYNRAEGLSACATDEYVAFCYPTDPIYTPQIKEYNKSTGLWSTITCPYRLATNNINGHSLFLNYDNSYNLWMGGDELVAGNNMMFIQKYNRSTGIWEDPIYAEMGNDLRGYFTPTTPKYDEFFVSWKFDTDKLEFIGVRVLGTWTDCDNGSADVMYIVLSAGIGSASIGPAYTKGGFQFTKVGCNN